MNLIKPGLYIVSTPIGNLQDITLRALEILQKCDLILCEDTRVTNKLLSKHNIKAKLKPYNDNSDENLRGFIKQQIINGLVICLVSDAGTPLISDPGYKLVLELKNNHIHVDVIPGPCAAISALTMSGLATDKFYFYGFLPKTAQGKAKAFSSISQITATIIFYETSSRLIDSLQVALQCLGDRNANIAREITKLYQESRTQKISELLVHYQTNPPKGEIVFSISGYENTSSLDKLSSEIIMLRKQNLSARSITEHLSEKYPNLKRSKIYKLVNEEIKS